MAAVGADIEALQHQWELGRLVQLYAEAAPKRVLEIGAMWGGTLVRWLSYGAPEHVVVIDDEMRAAAHWQDMAGMLGVPLALIRGKSQEADVVRAAEAYGPYDWVFVDADHRYDAGMADYRNYSPMVAPGGVYAMHDIRDYEHGNLGGVWQTVRRGRRSLEIVDLSVAEPWGGIGVLWI